MLYTIRGRRKTPTAQHKKRINLCSQLHVYKLTLFRSVAGHDISQKYTLTKKIRKTY